MTAIEVYIENHDNSEDKMYIDVAKWFNKDTNNADVGIGIYDIYRGLIAVVTKDSHSTLNFSGKLQIPEILVLSISNTDGNTINDNHFEYAGVVIDGEFIAASSGAYAN